MQNVPQSSTSADKGLKVYDSSKSF